MAGGPGKEVRRRGQQHTKSPEGKALLLEHAPEGVVGGGAGVAGRHWRIGHSRQARLTVVRALDRCESLTGSKVAAPLFRTSPGKGFMK